MRMRTYGLVAVWLAAGILVFGGEVRAAVFHWVDENGVHHYSNTPSKPEAEKLDIWEDGGSDPTVIYLDPQYNEIINAACAYYGVDPALVKAMIKVESNFNRYAVSRAGAQGLMQLMPGTARRFNVSDPFHPVENIWAGVYYIKFLMVMFNNNYDYVMAGYNAGENAVKKYNGIPPYKETRNYVKRVNYYWGLYKQNEPRWQKPAETQTSGGR
jgi:soluble lytic murein transglycosylase-like protein